MKINTLIQIFARLAKTLLSLSLTALTWALYVWLSSPPKAHAFISKYHKSLLFLTFYYLINNKLVSRVLTIFITGFFIRSGIYYLNIEVTYTSPFDIIGFAYYLFMAILSVATLNLSFLSIYDLYINLPYFYRILSYSIKGMPLKEYVNAAMGSEEGESSQMGASRGRRDYNHSGSSTYTGASYGLLNKLNPVDFSIVATDYRNILSKLVQGVDLTSDEMSLWYSSKKIRTAQYSYEDKQS